MIQGKTETGFEFKIEDEVLNNYELLELFAEVDENPLLVPKLVKIILGEEQKNKLIDHVRNENGIAEVDKVAAELENILTSRAETKN